MEQTILPILIMINRQGRKSKTAANLNLSIYRKNKHQLRISFFFKDKKKERERKKNNLKVMPLPQWPTPAGRVQWDVPWLHSDTFIITKNNNSSETKQKKT